MKRITLTESGLRKIVRRILKEEVGRILNESLNNFDAPLYHNTSMEYLLKMMLSNSIDSSFHRGYGGNGTHNGICFTRDKSYSPYTHYDVRLTFDVNKLLQFNNGLRLISYQDPMFYGIDEYEERIISSNGKPFKITNLSDMVTEVVIILDRTCSEIYENGSDIDEYLDLLRDIADNNIFGSKLKIVDNLKNMKLMPITEACDYIVDNCADDENSNNYEVYCVEYYDETDESWEYSEYTQNRNEAIASAEEMFNDEGIPTRVSFGEYDGVDFEPTSIVKVFGEEMI